MKLFCLTVFTKFTNHFEIDVALLQKNIFARAHINSQNNVTTSNTYIMQLYVYVPGILAITHFKVIWQFRPASVSWVHGDEDGARRVQGELCALKHEFGLLLCHSTLYGLYLLGYH